MGKTATQTHGDALLLAATENVHPVLHRVPAAFARQNVAQLHLQADGHSLLLPKNMFYQFKELLQFFIIISLLDHVQFGVRIDHLIAQCAQCHIRSLKTVVS
jgi:hypothetical protein